MLTRYYEKIRSLVDDSLTDGYAVYEYSCSLVFTLPDATISASTLKVYKNGTLVSPVNYSFDEASSKVTFDLQSAETLVAGDILEFYYKCYKKYTDTELRQYILSAIIRLSAEKYTTFILRVDDTIFPMPLESDENLICFIASILIEGNISSYRTNEVSISFGKDEDNESRIKRTIRQWKKCYGIISYVNTRKPYTIYVESSDMTLENLP
jgi:hypothetical protein